MLMSILFIHYGMAVEMQKNQSFMGKIFGLIVISDYGNTANGKMKNRKCR